MGKKILVIGSGMFGVAISQILIDNNHEVYMTTTNEKNQKNIMNGKHDSFNVVIKPPKMCYTDYKQAFQNNLDIVVLCIPSIAINETYEKIKDFLKPSMIIVNAAKGLNPNDLSVWSNLFIINNKKIKYSLLVGPSFATEIVNKEKTIVNIVSDNKKICKTLISIFNNSYFKLVSFDNEYVASLVSSFKNSLAIAIGLLNTYTHSINTRSAYLTIGINEIQTILSKLVNTNNISISDFFGLGDIYLTCMSDESRNFQFGESIAKLGFKKASENLQKQTVEGYRTLKLIYSYIKKYKLNCILFKTLYEVCYKNRDPKTFISNIWKKFTKQF